MVTSFEPSFSSCAPRHPVPDSLNARCGYLTVPEFHGQPGGRTVRLYATILSSSTQNPRRDPVVFLNGGPGSNSRGIIQGFPELLGELFLKERDFVVFDQRGTGYSEPRLGCPEFYEEAIQVSRLGLSAPQRARRHVVMALRCRDRLAAEGVNLQAYNTPESAADVADLVRALGYDEYNLYGVSYGTRLALAVMRDHPAGLRSVVLDSTVPTQSNQFAEALDNTAHAFNLLFDRCAADPAANATYPNLRSAYIEAVRRLNASPATVTVAHPDTGQPLDLRITGEVLTGLVYSGLYSLADIPRLPKLISDALAGRYDRVAEKMQGILEPSDLDAEGMYYSVNCCDDKIGPDTAAAISDGARRHPWIGGMPYTEFHLGDHIVPLCEEWGARKPGPAEFAPVVSNIPTLVLAGEFDPNTPASWGRLAAETLRNSYYFEFQGVGHGVVGSGPCAVQIVRGFLANPLTRPDGCCLDSLTGPYWELSE